MILASLIAQQTLNEYKIMLGAALNVGVSPIEAKEVVYQSVPYVGIAKAYDFIHATNDILESRGVKLPLERPIHHHSRNTIRKRAGAFKVHFRRGDRQNVRTVSGKPGPLSKISVGELFR